MRQTFLPFALPDTDQTEIDLIAETVRSGHLTTGPRTRQFEADFARFVGAGYAVAVNSCTAALHLALEAIGLKAGDEVITSPYTFAATAEVIRYFDARPVMADIEAKTFNLSPRAVEAAVTSRTRAVVPVHLGGLAAEMDEILAIARANGLSVIEDAAHAFPARYKGRMIGTIGDLTCFSFYATKTITTGEGGMITTENPDWADRCRIMALHGISKDAWKRYTAEGSWYYEIVAPGYKYNMTDVAAAMGLGQLTKADRMLRRRHEIAHRYNQAFAGEDALETPPDRPDGQHAWHLYMLRLNLGRLVIDRSRFADELKRRNIGTSVHFIPLHVHPYYRATFGYAPDSYPVAYGEYLRELSLPIYSRMTDDDVQDVIDAVLAIATENRR
jgi:dTDP-4-amino-4,6-dideoxygalactose transaminase